MSNWKRIVQAADKALVAAGGLTSPLQPASYKGFINRLYAFNRLKGSTTFILLQPESWDTINKILSDTIRILGGTATPYQGSINGTVDALNDLTVLSGGTRVAYQDSYQALVVLLENLAGLPDVVAVSADMTGITADSTVISVDRN